MPVLDLLARDDRITRITLIEPDVYKPHNVVRHVFGSDKVGQFKADLARDWMLERRPDLNVSIHIADLLDPARQDEFAILAASADIGVCAADNEQAKFHFDQLMRRADKPWTLGEVLSGGIGGFVHWFRPGGPCYGCVASHLRRSVETERPKLPDYSQPGGPVAEAAIPASRAAISAIASLHALMTLDLIEGPNCKNLNGFTSYLYTMRQVPGVFREAYRPHRFAIPRSSDCLVCRPAASEVAAKDLDAALQHALARLAHE